jgi:CHAT domain-containing protein
LAIAVARDDKNRLNELYPLLVQGLIAAQTNDNKTAESIFHEVENDRNVSASLKWRSQYGLARLYEGERRVQDADLAYRAAIATFENARIQLHRNEAKLPFLTNASHIYGDYIAFLVGQGKTNDALRWADNSRARTLAEGLGVLSNKTAVEPPALNPRAVAKSLNGEVLSYWLGEKQSYLWAVSPKEVRFFVLPAGTEIEAAVERYRKSLVGPEDVSSSKRDGEWLYHNLIAPAELGQGARIFVIPDGGLTNLNFETLLVPGHAEHYWIEDATVISASSLRMLAASRKSTEIQTRNLLLMGDSVAPNIKYPELAKAADQVKGVANHFPALAEEVITREQATPSAYLRARPERFSFIHFVAHGTASRLSPLDSAIILSKDGTNEDSFKLYARDIIQRPLHANLVTISACYGAGERAYSGEGLVGLSWAFLRAGAHNVIAALWEATDVSTEQLMGRFYDEMNKGATPDSALRKAKLSLLKESAFRNPFYWAPFQIYTGS